MRSFAFRLKLSVFAALFASVTLSHSQSTFRFAAQKGPSVVGFKEVEYVDDTRVDHAPPDRSSGEQRRALQILVWYPARESAAMPMTVRDYVEVASTKTDKGEVDLSPAVKQWNTAMNPTLSDSMWARRDAPLTPARFSVVIYAPADLSWENADLCEYLSSNGYVVIASAGTGPTTKEITDDVAGANSQAHDIESLVNYAKTLSDTEMSQVAVAGWSWGGLSGLFAAARDPRIKALVELDGSLRYYPGIIRQAGDVHPEQMTIPLIFFAQGEFTLEDQARYLTDPVKSTGPSALNAWTHGDFVMVHNLALMHTELSSMFQRNESIWKNVADQQKGDYGREYGIPGYAWVCRYTLAFLDGYLKHDQTARAFLKKTPAENGVPAHLLGVRYRAATP